MATEVHVHFSGLTGDQFLRADRFHERSQFVHPRKHFIHRPGREDDDHTIDVWFTDEAEAEAFRVHVLTDVPEYHGPIH